MHVSCLRSEISQYGIGTIHNAQGFLKNALLYVLPALENCTNICLKYVTTVLIHAFVYVHVCVCVRVRMHVRVGVPVHVHVHVCVYVLA